MNDASNMIGNYVAVVHTAKQLFKYKLYECVRIDLLGDKKESLYVMHVAQPESDAYVSVRISRYTGYVSPDTNKLETTLYPHLVALLSPSEMLGAYDEYGFSKEEIPLILQQLTDTASRQIAKTEILETEGIVYI
jgi:hypothetical protein